MKKIIDKLVGFWQSNVFAKIIIIFIGIFFPLCSCCTCFTVYSMNDPSTQATMTVRKGITETARAMPTATPSLTFTPQPTDTPLPLPTETPLPSPTSTPQPTSTAEPTNTPIPTNTPSPTSTPEPSADDITNQKIQSLTCDEDIFMQRLAEISGFIDLEQSSLADKKVVFKDGYVETEYYAYKKSLEASARLFRDFPCLEQLQIVIYRGGQGYITDVEINDLEEFLDTEFEMLREDIVNWRAFLESVDEPLVREFADKYITQELATDGSSPQLALETALKDSLGESNRNRDDRVIVLIEDSTIYVTFRVQDNFSTEWIRDGMGSDTLKILYVVRNSGLEYDELVVEGTFPLIDAYGNTEESTVLVATYKKDTVERINFEGVVKMFAIVDDELFIHPAMLED